jgi:hypothetical protein
MNETTSLLTATAILALGGLGLYMYKSDDKISDNQEETYNENSLFNMDFWNTKEENEEENENNEFQTYDEDEYNDDLRKRKVRQNKTKRQKKTGGTKRRY